MKSLKKITMFLLRIIVLSLKLAVNVLIKAETYALGFMMLPLLICIIVCIIGRMWLGPINIPFRYYKMKADREKGPAGNKESLNKKHFMQFCLQLQVCIRLPY